MNLMPIASFLPEFILLFGVLTLLLLGVSSLSKDRSSVAAAALGFLVLALLSALFQAPSAAEASIIPGLEVTSLTEFVRFSGLSVSILLLLMSWTQPEENERGEFFSLLLCSVLGLLLLSSATDLIVLFFAVELVSVPTYVLVALSRRDVRASESAVKYFFLGSLSAAILAYGLSMLYGAAGTTSMGLDPMAASNAPLYSGGLGLIGLFLVFAGLFFKIAAFPFHGYVADVYEGAAAPVTALLGFIPKIAGFVALIRILEATSWRIPSQLMFCLVIVAALTMTAGNTLALMQRNIKRMMAYSGVAHSGYMLVALIVGPVAGTGGFSNGIAALLFYMSIYGVMNLGVFAAMGMMRYRDREIENLDEISGLARMFPLAGIALAACVFSLMGFPPTAGFLGKVYVFGGAFSMAGTDSLYYPLIGLAVIGVINSAIGAGYYLRIISHAWREPVEGAVASESASSRGMLLISGLIVLLVFIMPSLVMNRAASVSTSVPDSTVSRIAPPEVRVAAIEP